MENRDAFIDLAESKIGQKYVFGANADFTDPDYNGPWDCAEFVSWIIYQVTGDILGCVDNNTYLDKVDPYTGGWLKDVRQGTVDEITVEEAINTPGAILLRRKGRAGHIAFSGGDGTTVEAMSRKRGVCIGSAYGRGWTHGILV